MKIGIISNHTEGPVSGALETIYKSFGYEITRFSQKTFLPKYVSEQSIDALLLEGRTASDEGFALAVRKHIPETAKMLYLFYTPKPISNLFEKNIAVLDVLDITGKEQFTKWLE